MSNYRLANTEAQWFQDDYPGADMHLSAHNAVVVLHTTESTDWPSYNGGADAPTYTAKPNKFNILDWRAHFPDEKSARALRNLAGGVETNTLNCVQVELVGTCDPAHRETWGSLVAGVDYIFWPDAPPRLLRSLARFLVDQHRRHGLKLVAPDFLPYPASYGASPARFTPEEWNHFVGICGHQHVPENVHGDPGNIDIQRVLRAADRILNPPTMRLVEANLHHNAPHVTERLQKARHLDGDVYFFSEAYNIHPEITKLFGADFFIIGGDGGSMGHREVQLVLRKTAFTVLDSGYVKTTKNLPDPGGVAHDRWYAWAKAEWHGKKFLLISWHGNAAIQSRKTGLPMLRLPRTMEYVKEIIALELFCEEAQGEGYEVIIAGDGNYRQRRGVSLWFYSPERLHRRMGLTTLAYGLDKIGFPAKVLDLVDNYTVSAPGADHPWVIADLEKPR